MIAAVSVVIPTLNEAVSLPRLLADLAAVPVVREVIVVDGGSRDGTPALAAAAGARVIEAPVGRGSQLRAGAAAARGPWLCFLHADVRVPPDARDELAATAGDAGCQAAVWRLAIDAEGWWFRVVEWGTDWRSRLGGLPYGDQGLLVRRALYERVGGHPGIPIMEDVALARALARHTAVRYLRSALRVSARRWHREGPMRTWVRNGVLLGAYLAGLPPERLAAWYRPEPGTRPPPSAP